MAAAAPGYQCDKCSRKTQVPRVLDCQHIMCERCLNHSCNEYVLHNVKPKDRQKPPTHVPCDVCHKMSKIPARGAPPGIADARGAPPGLADAMEDLSIKSKAASGKSTSGVRSSTKSELVWKSKDYPLYHDVTFLQDDQIVYITYDEDTDGEVKDVTLRVMDHKGNTSQLPFPVFLTQPVAVYGSRDGQQLAIIDRVKVDEYVIDIYTNTSLGWSNTNIITSHDVQRVALLPGGGCVCTAAVGDTGYSVVLFDADGQQVWVRQVTLPADGAPRYGVLLSTTPSGLIIICDHNTHKITVMDTAGQQLHQFPSRFIKEPVGVCADTQGDVLVYDDATKALSLFSMNGQYVRKIMDSDRGISGMSLYQDKYLICISKIHGLSLYKL